MIVGKHITDTHEILLEDEDYKGLEFAGGFVLDSLEAIEELTESERNKLGIVKCRRCDRYLRRGVVVYKWYSCESCKAKRMSNLNFERRVLKGKIDWKNPDHVRAYYRLQARRLRKGWGGPTKPRD